MSNAIPNTPNLAVGTKQNGWEITDIIDAPAGKYVVRPVAAGSGQVTCQSGSHAFNQTSTSNPSGVFSVTFPQPFANVPTVELTYQWNYNASTNGGALSPPLLVEGITTTGFSYRINGNRNALDRVLWMAVDPQSTIQAGNQVLTPRAITGSITSVGYDGIELPYTIPLAPGFVLDTVSLNGTATTNFDANTGVVRITPNGGPVAVTHTTKLGSTFTSPQVVGSRSFVNANGGGANGLSMGAAINNLNLAGVTLQEGDKITFFWRFNGDSQQDQSFDVYAKAGTLQRSHAWTDRTENWTFPATLNATVNYSASSYVSAPTLLSVIVTRYAENKTVVPTGTTVATAYTITVNGGANGSFTGHESIGPETFYLTNMAVDQEVDVFPTVAGVTLRNRQAGMFSVDRAVGAGNLALTGITFRNLGVKSKYFGTADNQPGDTGHTFTQRLFRGNGITTADGKNFVLSGGFYTIRFGVTHHKGPNCWRANALFVDGGEVCSNYTGHDGSNWEGGGDLEWVVDATAASHTIQMKRTASGGANGNVDCWLSIEREEGYALPEGYQTREACAITASGGSFANGLTSINIPTGTGQWVSFTLGAGNELKSCSGSAGLTVSTVDMKAGAAWVEVANGTTSGTLTVVIGAKSPSWAQSTVNRGVVVNLGSLKLQATPSGNMNFQIASNTGALITAKVSTTAPSYSGSSPDGTGDVTLSLAANGAFQSPRNFNFGGQGNIQTMLIEDQTNGRRYFVNCEVGAAFNNNIISGFEV